MMLLLPMITFLLSNNLLLCYHSWSNLMYKSGSSRSSLNLEPFRLCKPIGLLSQFKVLLGEFQHYGNVMCQICNVSYWAVTLHFYLVAFNLFCDALKGVISSNTSFSIDEHDLLCIHIYALWTYIVDIVDVLEYYISIWVSNYQSHLTN